MTSKRSGNEIVGAWLSEKEGVDFIDYAAQIGIDSTALATILLVRELNHDRLTRLSGYLVDRPVRKERRVSARAKHSGFKERFAEHAMRHGLSSDAAAAAVFRAELREKWLSQCVGLIGNQVDSHEE